MAVSEIFSKRQAKIRGDLPDVYTYDKLPEPLRVQLVQIISEAFGSWWDNRGNNHPRNQARYDHVVHTLRREYGMFVLADTSRASNGTLSELRAHLLQASAERTLDAVELCCQILQAMATGAQTSPIADEIVEINHRFREHGIGYEFNNGEIIRIDSELIHVEAVKPALQLLHGTGYEGAKEEFLTAYEYYWKHDNKEAVTNAAKAFESVMKAIMIKRGWQFDPNDTANKLIAGLYEKQLIPAYWQTHLGGLRAVLESAIATPRNKNAAHGQGAVPVEMPEHLAGYILHLTASTIVFLIKAEQALS